MHATDFLQRLGLRTDADERAIKRAYARELKLIDQERDAAGFQVLREAYEAALYWVKHKPAAPSFAPSTVVPVKPVPAAPAAPIAPAPPIAPPAPPRDNPQQLADAVFGEFVNACADVVAQGGNRDVALWRKRLDACANDERLLNLTARACFEYLVARLLADGWRPGHEGLFVAARQVFGWDRDARRLLEFGQLGAWLNQAIDESAMFTRQDSVDCAGQAAALERVREPAEPRNGELLTHVPHLRTLRARFPAWTSIIARLDRIEQWSSAEQALPAWRRRLRLTRGPKGMRNAGTGSGSGSWWKFVVAIVVVKVLVALMNSPAPRSSQTGFYPPVSEPARTLSPEEAADEERYRRAAGSLYMPPGTRSASPPEPGRMPNDLLSQTLPPFRPGAPVKPAVPAGRFLNEDEMQAISRRIDYRGAHVAPGKYMAKFQVELDAAGRIEKLTMQKSSGLQVLDKQVEEAIRASAPFSSQVGRAMILSFGQEYRPRRRAEPNKTQKEAEQENAAPAEAEPPADG